MRCLISWLVLTTGTYLAFSAGSVFWWIGSLAVFVIVRKAGRNSIPFRVYRPRVLSSGQVAAEIMAGCLLAPAYLTLELVGPLVVVGGMFILALKLENMGVSRPLFALYMTLPALIPYGYFILRDVGHLRELSRPAPPGSCVNCHYDLKGAAGGGRVLPPTCPHCHEPVPRIDAES